MGVSAPVKGVGEVAVPAGGGGERCMVTESGARAVCGERPATGGEDPAAGDAEA